MIFEKISNTNSRIEELNEKIYVLEMQACTPKSGAITGMPKSGSGAINPIEACLEKKEKLEEKLNILKTQLKSQWKQAVELMKLANINEQARYMMYLRFYEGLPWKQCNARLQEKYPQGKWNENKLFREYRNVLIKVRRAKRQSICS